MSYKNTLRVSLFSSAYLCVGPKRTSSMIILCISKGNNPTRCLTEIASTRPSVRRSIHQSIRISPKSVINAPSPAPTHIRNFFAVPLVFYLRSCDFGSDSSTYMASILFAIASSLKLLVGFFSKPGKNVRLFSCAPAIWVAIHTEVRPHGSHFCDKR